MLKIEKVPVEFFLPNPNVSRENCRRFSQYCPARIQNYSLNISNDRKPKSSYRPGSVESKALAKIKARPCDSTRDLARKCGTSKTMVQSVKIRNNLVSNMCEKKLIRSSTMASKELKRS